ncbi:MAG: hypothetical protein FWF54_01240 [Candidatus Azobacteroides sp.]|nr:hypothetical protein [Candidatus Azobacteroides sp.]
MKKLVLFSFMVACASFSAINAVKFTVRSYSGQSTCSIAGDFNGWAAAPMTNNGDGTFSINLNVNISNLGTGYKYYDPSTSTWEWGVGDNRKVYSPLDKWGVSSFSLSYGVDGSPGWTNIGFSYTSNGTLCIIEPFKLPDINSISCYVSQNTGFRMVKVLRSV